MVPIHCIQVYVITILSRVLVLKLSPCAAPDMWRVAYARVTSATISDTELQVARWVLPGPAETVSYQTNEELYRHWWEEDVDESWRFTRAFRGNGTR
jgi:hypothetical protein